MKRALFALLLGAAGAGIAAFAEPPPRAPVPEVKLWRLDCGSVSFENMDFFSDTYAFGHPGSVTDSCYLIRHGDDYMLWDTGLPAEMLGKQVGIAPGETATLKTTIPDQLAKIGVKPDQIGTIGISHYHADHTGQASGFPKARLLIGTRDFAYLMGHSGKDKPNPLAPWVAGTSLGEPIEGDKDVFGDGSVVMLATPGHTPDHHSLLVRLKKAGRVILTGDLWHTTENRTTRGVPPFNTSRAETLASMDRIEAMAKNLHALVVIGHEKRDIAKLPLFPASAD